MSACASPIGFPTLVALWSGELDVAQADRVEAHLFGCETCSGNSQRLGGLVAGLHEVIPPVLSHAQRARLLQRGMRILETPVEPDVPARAHFIADVDLLVHVLHAELTNAERVDVEVVMPDGTVQMSLEAVPFDEQAGEVLIACQRHFRGMYPEGVNAFFVVHRVAEGRREQAGKFLVEHIWD